jgi:hypothetical protein
LKDEHLAVFDCSFRPQNGVRSIHYRGHMRMMAAVQPFIKRPTTHNRHTLTRWDFSAHSRQSQIARSARIVAAKSSPGENMKIALNIAGVVLVVFGSIWFLQGINVLPGSFMTGQIRWAVYGGIAVAAGISLLLTARRRRRRG